MDKQEQNEQEVQKHPVEWLEEYRQYIGRMKQWYPDDIPLSLEKFKEACDRWNAEYDAAWECEPPDWDTIEELERLLAV